MIRYYAVRDIDTGLYANDTLGYYPVFKKEIFLIPTDEGDDILMDIIHRILSMGIYTLEVVTIYQ